MSEETTNGENTGEQGNSSAPAAGKKKFFQPAGADWKFDPRKPLNFRPRGEQIEYVVALIKEKGTQQLALAHCVSLAMASAGKLPPAPAAADQSAEITRLKKLLKDMERDLSTTQATLSEFREKLLKKNGESAFIPSAQALQVLKKIQTKRKLQSTEEAILYSIGYTGKNDWL